ncbi:UvrD-helicase domain-containing protein [Paenibacillus sp. HGF5]|uniref:UvrD-helicase domain-containing protein n=1 Tax=Paenibacillus sp. HGF5 TaxID=908341 RepID=UPI001584CAB3|nr:ATP-dependent helicase [Paenibacillus sp. HGF5]
MTSDDWTPADNMSFDSTSIRIIKSEVNTLISAGPGAGKTELLAQKASFLLTTNKLIFPRQLLALSYKVDAAKNLEERVHVRCGETLSKRFISRTYDAFAKLIVDQFCNLLPPELKPSIDYEIGTSEDVKQAYIAAGHRSILRDSYRFYINTYLVQYKLPFVDTEYGDIARKVLPILLKGNDNLQPKLTFPIIARLAEYIVRNNPSVRSSLQLTFGHVFLDEFQDTPEHHYDLIKSAFRDQGNILTAVGDKKQRVMVWAGAADNIFERFTSEFNAVNETLLVNHRSAPKLVSIQQPIIKSMTGQDIIITPNDRWSAEDGISEVWGFENEKEESLVVSQKIKELIEYESLSPNDICILTRKLPAIYTKEIMDMLERNHIHARVEEKYQTLLKEDVIQIIQSIILLALPIKAPDEWAFIIKVLRQLHGYNSRTSNIVQQTLESNFISYLKTLELKMASITNEGELYLLVLDILNYLDRERLRGLYRQYNNAYLDTLIKNYVNLLWIEYETCTDWVYSIERFKGMHSIPVMSIHKSKGLEYKVVFLIGLEDDAFFGDNIDEELCTFFVAISRAIEQLFITKCDKRGVEKKTTNKVKPFFILWNSSGIGQFVSFKNEFNKKFNEYFGIQ